MGFSSILLIRCYDAGEPKKMSTWVWDGSAEVDLHFAQSHNVNQLYYYVNTAADAAAISSFIEKANNRGIEVYALQGEPEWAEESEKALEWLSGIKQYNEQSAFPFAGVVFDIEPYLLPKWEGDSEKISRQFLSLIKNMESREPDLSIKWTIPFWFDQVPGEKERSLAESIFKEADEVIVMAYRRELSGQDGLLTHIEDERKWSEYYKTSLTIAIETKKAEAEKISFYGAEKGQFDSSLKKLQRILEQDRYIEGLSIHYLDTWKELVNGEKP
jgi:hypothetical protein